MKLKVKVKTSPGLKFPQIIDKGDFIDLCYAGGDIALDKGDFKILGLGVAMQLPDGFEAIVVSRSSTFKNFGIFNPGGFGVIDNSYCGNNDIWKYPAYAAKRSIIHYGDRICQFRIQLSQKATFWQKLKWLFSNGIEIIQVDSLNSVNRGGIGSTGRN